MKKNKFSDITPKRKKQNSAIDNFIDGAEEYQNKSSVEVKEPVERLNVVIPRSMHKAIKLKAVEEDTKIKDIVIKALNDHLKQ